MKMMKIEKVTSDAVVANTAFTINVESISQIVVAATTCTVTFNKESDTLGTVTFTVDGADAAEKLLNATKIADHIAKVMAGPGYWKGGVHNLITDYAAFESLTGIVNTGGTGPLVTTAIA